jgi:ubiquinone/menaquinone biosynthesis C-methylase UbiE
MEYIAAPAEDVPFPDSYFDVVCSFNSLDHVSDVDLTISEIKRVTKTAGLFLLLVEINHPPQECEPHEITPEIIHHFEPTFDCLDLRVYLPVKEGLYMSIKNGIIHPEPEKATEISWLSVMFKKN